MVTLPVLQHCKENSMCIVHRVFKLAKGSESVVNAIIEFYNRVKPGTLCIPRTGDRNCLLTNKATMTDQPRNGIPAVKFDGRGHGQDR